MSPVEGNSLNVKSIAPNQWPKEKVDRDIDSSLAEYLAITQVDELALNLKDLKEKSGRPIGSRLLCDFLICSWTRKTRIDKALLSLCYFSLEVKQTA